MKLNHLFLSLVFLFCLRTSFGQTILNRVINNDPSLLIFASKDTKSFTVAAAIDKQTHVCYLLSCYGNIVDSVKMADGDYARVQSKVATPFDYFNAFYDGFLKQLSIAQIQLHATGEINPRWAFGQYLAEAFPELTTQPNVLRKIMLLDEVREHYLIRKWLLNNQNPKNFPEDSVAIYLKQDRAKGGTMIKRGDTTLFYNQDHIAKAYKAMLLSKVSRILYYDRNNSAIDSLSLRPAYVSSLLGEKTDVFSLYKAWLEMQLQSIATELKTLDSVNKEYHQKFFQTADNRATNITELLVETRRSFSIVEEKIAIAAIPDPKAIATKMHDDLQSANVILVAMPGLGVGYATTFIRGNKRYELTDNRGNVVAVVSDRKSGIDSNSDGTVDYYRPDVVSATDYYPFGAQEPGRTFIKNGEQNFRYGYNGKENDDEVKGVGDQQDYGMRIYDPRVGRFLSVDPLSRKYAELTPYQFASNRPIDGVDLDGKEYSPAGLNNGNPRATTAVVIMLNPEQLQAANAEAAKRWHDARQDVMREDNNGLTHIGPRSEVDVEVAGANIRHATEIGDNLKGPGGSLGFVLGGEHGSYIGASVDGVMMSTTPGAVPDPNSSAFPNRQMLPLSSSGPANTEAPFDNRITIVTEPLVNSPKSPGEIAAERYPGVAENYGKQTIGQLQKTIRNTEKTIEQHEQWVKDPLTKPGLTKEIWESKDPRERTGLIKKWEGDIERNKAYLQIAKDALKTKQQ
ncbi:RHS repeat domain-containing protein [Dinghuibacter silviterrae]|uniref:RHS repeat-associated protein n=1 Tax=Dinghuibacter silviterrae TaxID=1539049 RepID=A0A4V3GKV9_9BACT|nr:RHS repeat-associated core domain-containing protein [Dinghuibacter silviterrae]TDW97162.1 RHS repeat-associated protein [Dinghuibacter silviterrae]